MKTELIVALDLDSLKKAKRLVELLYPKVKIFKVGLRLFVSEGPSIVEWLIKKGAEVFLDLKLYDIPNTMKETAKVICRLNVSMFTVHLKAEEESFLKVKEALTLESERLQIKRPLIIGVTVLTSQKDSSQEFLCLVKKAQRLKIDGIVASVRDLELIDRKTIKELLVITPGIRLEDIPQDDQRRTATPLEARAKGVDYIVVGRPILEAKDPIAKTEEILKQLR